jgi:hypothetical protein
MMWLFSGAPEDPEDDTMIEKHGADALYSAVNSLMHVTQTEDEEAQQDLAQQIIEIVNPWMVKWWSQLKLANRKPLVRIPMQNAHLIHLDWTEEEQAHVKTMVESYPSWGATGVWTVYRWRLACPLLVLGDTKA